MTFSNRRRLIRLLWAFAYNGFTPFLFGVLLSFFLTSSAMLDALKSFDKSGLGVCIVEGGKQ